MTAFSRAILSNRHYGAKVAALSVLILALFHLSNIRGPIAHPSFWAFQGRPAENDGREVWVAVAEVDRLFAGGFVARVEHQVIPVSWNGSPAPESGDTVYVLGEFRASDLAAAAMAGRGHVVARLVDVSKGYRLRRVLTYAISLAALGWIALVLRREYRIDWGRRGPVVPRE